MKTKILNTESSELQKFGSHFIVGYRNFEDLKLLVERGGIGGIFITQHNVKNKSLEEIQAEIKSLQSLQLAKSGQPLIIMTDQEGGLVSRLSPPLTRFPALSSLVKHDQSFNKEEIITYASKQAKEFKNLGINVNLAPVVDLDEGLVNSADLHTRIYERAISNNPELVAEIGKNYCETLAKFKVFCTLKHFPGLGFVQNDTHIQSAQLKRSLEELQSHEFIPFQNILKQSPALLMLSHVKLSFLDPETPSSFSGKVIEEIIRKSWQFEGVLITDDFSMEAIHQHPGGFQHAVLEAINHGVDLILISYDPDLYYQAMDVLLESEKQSLINNESIEKSKMRIKKLLTHF